MRMPHGSVCPDASRIVFQHIVCKGSHKSRIKTCVFRNDLSEYLVIVLLERVIMEFQLNLIKRVAVRALAHCQLLNRGDGRDCRAGRKHTPGIFYFQPVSFSCFSFDAASSVDKRRHIVLVYSSCQHFFCLAVADRYLCPADGNVRNGSSGCVHIHSQCLRQTDIGHSAVFNPSLYYDLRFKINASEVELGRTSAES